MNFGVAPSRFDLRDYKLKFRKGIATATYYPEQFELKMPKIYYHTKEYWDAQPTLVSEDQAIYVYTNYQSASGKDVAGMKIGDGSSYLIDVPFMDEVLMSHIQDTTIHITQQEREFWNNKVRSYVSDVSEEELIFTIH